MSLSSVVKIPLSILILCLLIECKATFTEKAGDKNTERVGETKEKKSKQPNWYDGVLISTKDEVYAKNIKTAFIHKTGLEINEPVILLNSLETITLRFDDLDGYLKDYSYSLIHCDKDWNESGLVETEYLQGFFINPVTDYSTSFNTLQTYINYSVTFPNEDLKILRSGNYVVRVYLTNNTDNIILTKRFMVYENLCEIKPTLKRTNDALERNFKQEIDFSIITNLSSTNNYDVVIRQNSRWDNSLTGFKPIFYKGNELVYDLDIPNIFNGGNEFRYLDLRRIPYTTERVGKIERTDSIYEAQLLTDKSRAYKKYLTNQDINGNFIIQNQTISGIEEHHRESDYIWTHFYLEADQPYTEGTLYLLGSMSNWDFLPEFRMEYVDTLKMYHKKVLLKQGYFNYQYVILKDNKKAADEAALEGSHYDTENNYSIYVYFRDVTNNYDRIVGYKPFNTITR